MTESLGRMALPLLAIDVATRGGPYPMEGRTKLTKLVFLAQREGAGAVDEVISPDHPYPFVPYHYGPFSRELIEDLEQLDQLGFVNVEVEPMDSEGKINRYLYSLTDGGCARLRELESVRSGVPSVRAILQKYGAMSRGELVEYVYNTYPDSIKA